MGTVRKCSVTEHSGFGQVIIGHKFNVTAPIVQDKLCILQEQLAKLKRSVVYNQIINKYCFQPKDCKIAVLFNLAKPIKN